MMEHAIPIYAAGVSPTGWGVIAACATAVVALMTLTFNQMKQHKESIDEKVSKAVDAKIGRTLTDLRASESEVKVTAEEAQHIEQQLREGLAQSKESYRDLGKVIQSATNMLPAIKKSVIAIPGELVRMARKAEATGEVSDANAYLSALSASNEGSSWDYEAGGDVAKRLRSYRLAADLYEKSTTMNPLNSTAVASLIHTQAALGQLTKEEVSKRATEHAMKYPHNREVIGKCCNAFISLEDYEGLLQFCNELMKRAPEEPIIWRNLAIALEELAAPATDISKAYDNHLSYISKRGDEKLDNVIRPYLRFVLRERQYEKAREILKKALRENPRSIELLESYAEVEIADSNLDQAALCYEKIAEISDGGDSDEIASEGMKTLQALRSLQRDRLVP
ncbi:tetratricopeptide repeat protein [Streptomyces sp. NPDC048324]|uniref:tetratricopeptide repeat protein n=1 Tax=Streptomyces sp. NPDC048324 TaxID=3157205 RepID=UPI00344961A2